MRDILPSASGSTRQQHYREACDRMAAERGRWIDRNQAFYADDFRFMRFLIPAGARVLDLGCGTGRLLAELRPSEGIGVDLSVRMIEIARREHPELRFVHGDFEDPAALDQIEGPFDFIVLSDAIGFVDDCQLALKRLHRLCTPCTRIVIAYFNQLWRPLLRLGEVIGQKMREPPQSWLSLADVRQLLELADFEFVRAEHRQLLPRQLSGLGWFVNNFIAPLPFLRRGALRYYVVARPVGRHVPPALTCSIIVPCRNERDNIEPLVKALPPIGASTEIVMVEGHSKDGTYEECLRVQAAYPERQIVVVRQDGIGKADAVRKGFSSAHGDIVMILDADRTVPPEDMPKFYDVLASGKGEFVNGTRLVYPMESEAMRFLNHLANRAFAVIFSWLLGQRFTDTLCGTKALYRGDYARIEAGRAYFGDFDPFGDFDLIFGAAKLSLKVAEVPVRYRGRRYGETQISRFRHGCQLSRMVVFAYQKLKTF